MTKEALTPAAFEKPKGRKRALTAIAVEKMKPPETGQVDHFDAGYPGLALRVSYGGGKSWTYHYRIQGKQRRMTLGAFPMMTLADAREACRDAKSKLDNSIDPAAAKMEAKQAAKLAAEPEKVDTVRSVGEDFIRRYCKPRNRTADEVARMFENHLYPDLGERPIESVTRMDILRLLDRAEEKGLGAGANRILANVRRMFGWAVERGKIGATPVVNVKAPAEEKSRDRVLTDIEVVAFLRASEQAGDPFGPLFKLLLLTAQRREEVAAARWAEIDLTERLWSLPAGRVKNGRAHVLPLSDQALALIAALPSRGKSEFLFPARFARVKAAPPRPVSGFGRTKERLDALMLEQLQKMAGERGASTDDVTLADWRLHDLRRTAASGMARLGTPIHVTEKVLNHVSGVVSGVAAVYNRHSYRDEMRSALQAWANSLDALTRDIPSNVVRIAEVG